MLRAPVPRPSKVTLAIGAFYTLVLLAMTVTPVPGARTNPIAGGAFHPEAWFATSTWTIGLPGEVLANVILFIPLGWFAARLLPLPFALLAPVVFSMGIEFMQLFLPGRVSDPRDLVVNALGGLIGVLIARVTAPTARRDSSSAAPGKPAPVTR